MQRFRAANRLRKNLRATVCGGDEFSDEEETEDMGGPREEHRFKEEIEGQISSLEAERRRLKRELNGFISDFRYRYGRMVVIRTFYILYR